MENESRDQHILFVFMLAIVLYLSYCAVPVPEKEKISHAPTHKTEHVASHDSGQETSETAREKHEAEKEAVHEDTAGQDKKEAPAESSHGEEGASGSSFDLIVMNNPKYKKHKKGIVTFTHKVHIESYGISCGSCHHDENAEPLDLKEGDPVQNCIECHKETEKPKDEKLSKEERIAKYHFEAIHANCIGCHKAFNIEKGDPKGKGPAPVSCTKCHPKKKK